MPAGRGWTGPMRRATIAPVDEHRDGTYEDGAVTGGGQGTRRHRRADPHDRSLPDTSVATRLAGLPRPKRRPAAPAAPDRPG
jgi:hypothetical protein